jgi:uncharacterized protein (DUF2249 family)
MPAQTLDLRDMPPAQRHPKIHEAFAALDSGETEFVADLPKR